MVWAIVRERWRKWADLILRESSLFQKTLRRQLLLWFILILLLQNLIVLWIIKNHHICLSLGINIRNWYFLFSLFLATVWWFVKNIVQRMWNSNILQLGLSRSFLRSRDRLFPWSTYCGSFQFFSIFYIL